MYTKINEKDSAMKLGAIYSKEKTTFTLFSPVADSVFVIFYDKGKRGIWMVFIIHMRFTPQMAHSARMIRMQEPAV